MNKYCVFMFVCLFSLLLPAILLAQVEPWKIINVSSEPQPREDCSFVEVDGLFYLIGGRGIKPVEVFNPVTKQWSKNKETPIELHHFQAISYQHEIYVIGAMNGHFPHERPLENIYIYNPQRDEWRKGAAIPTERQRGSGGTVVFKDKFYFVAGIRDGHWDGTVNWFDVFDPATGNWQVLADAPHARDHFHAAVVGNRLYLAGGRRTSLKTGQLGNITEPGIDVYDFNKEEWSTLANTTLPTQRAGCTAVGYHNQLIVIGGESERQESSHHEVEVLNINRWHLLPSLVTGRHDTQAVLFKNHIYIVAGSANRGGGPDQSSIEMLKLK